MSENARDRLASVLDSHVHLWDEPPAPGMGLLDSYDKQSLLDDIDSTRGTVSSGFYVESSIHHRVDGPEHLRPVGETAWVMAQRPESCLDGIVAFADMRLGRAVLDTVDAHQLVAGPFLRGVRHSVVWDSDSRLPRSKSTTGPGLLLDRQFQSGVDALAGRDLCFETWCYFHQLDEVVSLARSCPETRIVVDHMGGPIARGPYADTRAEVLGRWRTSMTRLAEMPNVYVKIGGIAGSLLPQARPTSLDVAWAVDYFRDEILFCLEKFGAERCMLESNYPVDSALGSYAAIWEVFDRVLSGASVEEKGLVSRGTAERTFRIGGVLPT